MATFQPFTRSLGGQSGVRLGAPIRRISLNGSGPSGAFKLTNAPTPITEPTQATTPDGAIAISSGVLAIPAGILVFA